MLSPWWMVLLIFSTLSPWWNVYLQKDSLYLSCLDFTYIFNAFPLVNGSIHIFYTFPLVECLLTEGFSILFPVMDFIYIVLLGYSTTKSLVSARTLPPTIPTAIPGSTKYGPNGLFSINSFHQLTTNSELCILLSNLANHSLSKSTWSTYKTSYKMLLQCFDNNVNFPLTQPAIVTFIGWLANRNLSVSTINSYLAGLRQVHLALGHDVPHLRSEMVTQILNGKKNFDAVKPSTKPVRIPVTPTLLRILKNAINKDDLTYYDKRLFWFLCVVAFHGSFRIGELLTRHPNHFDPNYALLGRHIFPNSAIINAVSSSFLEITISSSKCCPTTPTVIDVYPTGSDICPVRAYTRLINLCRPTPNLPAFRFFSGKNLTPALFNKKLRHWLKDYIDFNTCSVSGHSFRAGIPTILASMGYSNSDIKSVGRWSSRAFLLYTKLPRTKRIAMAQALGNLNI